MSWALLGHGELGRLRCNTQMIYSLQLQLQLLQGPHGPFGPDPIYGREKPFVKQRVPRCDFIQLELTSPSCLRCYFRAYGLSNRSYLRRKAHLTSLAMTECVITEIVILIGPREARVHRVIDWGIGGLGAIFVAPEGRLVDVRMLIWDVDQSLW